MKNGPLPLLDLLEQIEQSAAELREAATQPLVPEKPLVDGRDIDAELYGEVNASIIAAIRESGLTREEVCQCVCLEYPRGEDDRKRLSINMLNNYLAESKPDSRIPLWLLEAICRATNSLGPLNVLARRLGGTVITEHERLEQQLGRLDAMQRELAASKAECRRLIRQMRRAGGDAGEG